MTDAKRHEEVADMAANGFVTVSTSDQGTPFVESYGLLLASILLGSNGKPPAGEPEPEPTTEELEAMGV